MQSKYSKIRYALFCFIAISCISCKKFISEYSQNDSYINNVADLQEVLLGDAYFNKDFPISSMFQEMDDDVKLGIPKNTFKLVSYAGFHYWQEDPRVNSDGVLSAKDDVFAKFYSKIARTNAILAQIELFNGREASSVVLNAIEGEAYFLRAYYHFILVNFYGKPYKKATAATDFGIPLKTSVTIKDQFAIRSNVELVYNQIIADLLEAEKNLTGVNKLPNTRASLAAVQALLSRVYLFVENYDQASIYADRLIDNSGYKLPNFNVAADTTRFLMRNSEELIFTIYNNHSSFLFSLVSDEPTDFHLLPSDQLIALFNNDDLRLKAFFTKNSKGVWKFSKRKLKNATSIDAASDIFSIRLSETYLNKAEALAMLGKYEEARRIIQEFRKFRFEPSKLPSLSLDGSALVEFIRDERRRELCGEAHRWFDLRRYAVNSIQPYTKTIRHRSVVFTGAGYAENGYYELGTYEQDMGAYIVPVSNDEIDFNQGLLINAPRAYRPLKN